MRFIKLFRRDTKKGGKYSGFTLIEVVVELFILSMIASSAILGFGASVKSVNLAKAKIRAVALANEKMEEIRNMPYNGVATKHGAIYPPGQLEDAEIIERDGIEFELIRSISYVDDPSDGNAEGTISGKQKDLYSYDYKKIEITVKKKDRSGRLAFLTSNMAGNAAETPTNTGMIKACVVDSNSQPVAEAVIKIENSILSPAVDLNLSTSNDGCVFVPSLPPDSHNQYHIEVTKSGYSIDMTYPRTPQNPNSSQPDLNVLIQQVTTQTFIIDKLSTLTIDIVDSDGSQAANADLHIEGKKLKWFNPSTPKFSGDFKADAAGRLLLNNLEFDDYTISVVGKTIATTSPCQPVSLKASTNLPVKIILALNDRSPQIASSQPALAKVSNLVSLTITGQNLMPVSSVKLVGGDGREINSTNLSSEKHQNESIYADFNLENEPPGLYDILLQTGSGVSIRQERGFELIE